MTTSAASVPCSLGEVLIVMRGGGDIATGVALRLYRAGLKRLVVLERPVPLAVRRRVALSEAVHDGMTVVEGMAAHHIAETGAKLGPAVAACHEAGQIPVLVDPEGKMLTVLAPHVLIDVTLAKRNVLGLCRGDAPLVVAVGPGFTAGRDADCVIESNRGARLGRVLYKGEAEPNTGLPGTIGGFAAERVLRAHSEGVFVTDRGIGDRVRAGEDVGEVSGEAVRTVIDGTVRGLLRSGTPVQKGLKIGDVDPRFGITCDEVSDKALAIGGGVLEAVVSWHLMALRTGLC